MSDNKDILDESLNSVTGGSVASTEEKYGDCPVCGQFCKQRSTGKGYKKLKSTGESVLVITWKCSACNNQYYREYFGDKSIHLSSDFE